jgi:dipeptidyl-peptidase-4
MRRFFISSAVILSFICLVSAALAQERMLTIDDLFDPVKRLNFNGTAPRELRWMKDGASYLQFDSDSGQLVKVNAATGETKPFYDAAKMQAAFAAIAGISAEEAREISHRSSYHLNPAETATLLNTTNDLFYYEFGSDKAVRLTDTPKKVEEGEEFSPDGRLVSFARNNNLYIIDLATRRERALTSDGTPKIFNGRLNWVYQEELYGRGNFKGYWWSPDSTKLVYLQLNDTPVHEFTIVDHIPHLQDTEITPYPKAGDPNPTVKLGVVNAAGGATRWVDILKYTKDEPLIVRAGWTPDGKKVFYEIQNREQTWLDLNTADPTSGKSDTLVKETSKAWVNAEKVEEPQWLKDGSFLLLSERNGWLHVYHYNANGKLIRQVTDGKWDIRSLHGVDETNGYVYFSGTKNSYIGLDAYRIKLDGTGLVRLTQTDGTHNTNFNSKYTHFIDSWSDINTPTQVRLFKTDGTLARVIDQSPAKLLTEFKLSKPELMQIKARDGYLMEAMMIKPPGFDPKKQYPAMTFIYSGPQSPQVRNAWGGTTFMWYQMLAQRGYIIWVCDNRTASAKGAESAWPLFRNFGELEMRDLDDAVNNLKGMLFVDRTRVGISGWSFGGYMTSYALTHSKQFKIGIAGGSVTDWRLYDTIYTERYMGTPQNNPEGYKKSSVLAAAKDLNGKLLLIHGMIDDNVHMQNTIQFAYELQKANKQFQLMLYPKSRHGVVDPYLVRHMRSLMTDFILQNL